MARTPIFHKLLHLANVWRKLVKVPGNAR